MRFFMAVVEATGIRTHDLRPQTNCATPRFCKMFQFFLEVVKYVVKRDFDHASQAAKEPLYCMSKGFVHGTALRPIQPRPSSQTSRATNCATPRFYSILLKIF